MSDKAIERIYRYWGKACSSEENGPACHLLAYHGLDVAAVGQVLLDQQPSLLQQFVDLSGIDSSSFLNWSIFLLAVHDVGKFGDGFQNQRPDLFQQLQKRSSQVPYPERHDTLGYRFCREHVAKTLAEMEPHDSQGTLFEEDLWDLLEPWFCAVTGHHGRPPKLDIQPPPMRTQFPDLVRMDALAFVRAVFALFLPNGLPFQMDDYDFSSQIFNRISWWIAGLAVVSDWIGSNRHWFPYRSTPISLTDYWSDIALPRARMAVGECDLSTIGIAPFSGMRRLFPHIPTATPLQQLAEEVEIAREPQLFIIEEVTGGGKTEAALTLAHRLMAMGAADGLFMALPTMATANAMHARVQAVYRKVFVENSHPSLILAHSTSRMTLGIERKHYADQGYGQEDRSASQDCAAWLADSRKKALLAHVGVGTIDQALLAILAVRHQSLRLFGLARKVLIVDEVHACDAYVHRLLCTLLQFHAAQGGSAILLSATLPQTMRADLLSSFVEGTGTKTMATESTAYPLLTHFSARGVREFPVAARQSVSRHVEVQPLHSADEITRILRGVLELGGCACWVRNTVHDALQVYRDWAERWGEGEMILFHARFTLSDRLKIEQEVMRRFGVHSTEVDRRGKLLIATQVVEQSLDLDFDLMISDLAPIDLLIQRAGRLHRHTRGWRKPPVFGVYMPQPMKEAGKDWYEQMFPKAANVYKHHGQLWLTARWMDERRGFSMPGNAREMIETVYGEASQMEIPHALMGVEIRVEGEDSAAVGLASLNSKNLDEGYRATMGHWQDDVSAPTRLGEPTVTVRLAHFDGKELRPWNAENAGYDWELSQLTVRRARIAGEDPENLPEFVAAARRTMSDEGRYCVVIPLQQSDGKWMGRALNPRGETVHVAYDARTGLEVIQGEPT